MPTVGDGQLALHITQAYKNAPSPRPSSVLETSLAILTAVYREALGC